MTKLSKYKC